MGFLNAMLLFGAAAFVVPLGIHLLNRSRFYSVDWAAMHLLDASDLQHAHRIEWRSLLLLLLRCLIPVVLAVCMARPMLQTAVVGGVRGRSTTVLVLDTSYSMQGHVEDGPRLTRGWDAATAAADRIVDELASQAELAVVAIGGEARRVGEPSRRDPRPTRGAISRVAPQQAGLDLVAGLRLAGETLSASSEPHRQAVVISDFQRSDWTGSVEAAIEVMRRQWEALPAPPEIHLIPLDIAPQANASVVFDAPATEVGLLGEPLDLQLTVENHGDQPLAAVPLRLAVDGRALVSRQVDLAPNATSQLLVTVEIEKPGDSLATVVIEDPAKQIIADDTDQLRIQTLPASRVLLIEPAPQPSLFACETGFLQLALEATAGETGKGRAAEIHREAAAAVEPAAIEKSDVIVLADVPRLSERVVDAIAKRVDEGGLLCVFPGESLDPAWYQQALGPAADHPLLPWRYGEPVAADGDATALRDGPYADSLLAFFDDPQHGQLSTASLTAWREMAPWRLPEATDAAGSQPVCLLQTQRGEPMLVASGAGDGRVLQWAITADEASGTLPTEAVFVPLMQRLLLLDLSAQSARQPDIRRQESTLDPLSGGERNRLAAQIGATLHDSAEAFLAHNRNRQGGREIWRWLLGLVVALLFAEMLLAGRLTRRGGP